jgi:hypothetical protein
MTFTLQITRRPPERRPMHSPPQSLPIRPVRPAPRPTPPTLPADVQRYLDLCG